MITTRKKASVSSIFSLFSSASTLVCCALPALFVALGAGAVLSTVVAAVPQMVWLSIHKTGLFSGVAVILIISGYLQWQARTGPCPNDKTLARTCEKTRKISLITYCISVTIFLTGGFFALIAPLITA